MGENLDIITVGEGLIELSSNKSLTYAQTLDKYYGGDTLCTAVAAQRLGSKVGYITRVGTDYFKEFLLDSWQLEGLDISQVKLVDGINGIYFVALPEDGEKEIVDIAGNLCTSLDVMAEGITLPIAKTGDIVAVTNAGSYGLTLSPAMFSSHRPPKEFLL